MTTRYSFGPTGVYEVVTVSDGKLVDEGPESRSH